MKIYLKFLYLSIGVLVLSVSCENFMDKEKLSPLEDGPDSKLSADLIMDDIIEELKVTKEQEEKWDKIRFKNFSNKKPLFYNGYDDNLFMNMYAIRDLPVVFEARGTANTYSKFLSANGAGKEITLVNTVGPNQKFFIKVLPTTSGIPYKIYSNSTNTPLSIGQYVSNPSKNVLYAMQNSTGDMSYTGWDFIPTINNPGYFSIQNQKMFGQNNNEGLWDIFSYRVLEVENDNKIGITMYRGDPKQEFQIQPDVNFKIKDVLFVNPQTGQLIQKPNFVATETVVNPSSQVRYMNIQLVNTVEEESYFRENKSISFKLNNPFFKFARPTVTLGEIDVIPNLNLENDTFLNQIYIRNIVVF